MLPAEELERVACLLLALGGQLVEQELFERLWGEMALEHAGDRHRDRARLLGDDDNDGIGDLADADARAMARARSLLILWFSVSGKTQPAAAMRSLRMMTAPSWSDALVKNRLRSSSEETQASTTVPLFWYSSSGMERSKTMSTPVRSLAMISQACTVCSMTRSISRCSFLDGKDLADIFAAELFEHTPQLRLEHNDQATRPISRILSRI